MVSSTTYSDTRDNLTHGRRCAICAIRRTLGLMSTDNNVRWIPDTTGFPVRLMLVRHQMGWNLKEAALACGLPPQCWRHWELQGRRPRDYESLCKQIAKHTGCDLLWLMSGEPGDGATAAPIATIRGRSSPAFQPTGWYEVA